MVKSVAKCTPSLGTVSIWWCRCSEAILWPMSAGKSVFYLRDKVGGEIAEVRNGIVESVLAYDAVSGPVSHLFWVDDDVLVFPGCLLELMSHDADVASGVYFSKMPGRLAEPLIFREPDAGTDRFVPDKVYPVWGHGMGLTLVKTDVYRKMRDELNLPKDKYGRTQWYHTTDTSSYVWEDERGVIHTGFTEDLWFLGNVARLGIRPVVDTTKHAFGFHYRQEYVCACGFSDPDVRAARQHKARFLEHVVSLEDRGYPEEQWNQWIRGESIRWQTPEGSVVWN